MTFLQPALLAALPLAALPIIIHLIHLYRRRQVKWAAMMFLLQAQKMNKGLSRLRQVLILAFRVLAVAAIIFVATRPLSGGWLGLTGGAPDTVLVLLDRSASMEQQNVATGISKREAGLQNIAKAINDAVGTRSRLVLIDSATLQAETMTKADALLDLPKAEATDTGADIPGLLQAALDYITTNQTGRTDVWVLSDLQQSDWDASGGRWETLRSAFTALQGVRFHVLAYPQLPPEDLAVRVERVTRRETPEKAELLIDFRITRQAEAAQPGEVPVRVVVNGTATTMNVAMKENQVAVQGHAIPIDKASKRGWGRVELPADASAENNVFHFVFDEPAPMHSVIVSEDEAQAGPLKAALSAAADPSRQYLATVLSPARAAEIPWDEVALIVWHAPIPNAEDVLAKQLINHAAAGRSIIFLPPAVPDDSALFGLRWGQWTGDAGTQAQPVEWWRNDADLLANTRDNSALPVGSLEVLRRCAIIGEGVPLARVEGNQPLLMRSSASQAGSAYFLGTLPGPGVSSLARDGVVMFALLHRSLHSGAKTLGKAQQRDASAGALGADVTGWKAVEQGREGITSMNLPLRAGIVGSEQRLVALNRPAGEDRLEALSPTTVSELFAGLDFRLLTDSLEDGRSLTSEIWRTFLMLMALAIVGEALLCMPGRREVPRPTSRPADRPPVRREPEPAELAV